MSARGPHVVVDVRLAHAAGHRTYIRNLIPRLLQLTPHWRWSLLGDANHLRDQEWARGANIAIVPCDATVYSVREQIEVPMRVPRDADLYWATHYNVPLALRKRIVLTIHDVAHLRLPEYTSSPARYAYARIMMQAALSRASAVMCDSEFSRVELHAVARAPAAVTSVIHLGIERAWFEEGDGPSPPERPYFVFVGSLKPHKNVRTLLAAFRLLEGRLAERLVIIGKTENLRTPDSPVLADIAALEGKVVLAGEVADAQLRAVVRGATALVLPSLYEGFGFPPLEAMAAGCPAIVSRSGSLPEVCGDAALYCDALDPAQLARAMEDVARDPAMRQRMVERGLVRARLFDWAVTSRQTLEVIQSALASD